MPPPTTNSLNKDDLTKMPSSKKRLLLELVENEKKLISEANPKMKKRVRINRKSWVKISDHLNMLDGPTKTVKQWKKMHNNIMYSIKNKLELATLHNADDSDDNDDYGEYLFKKMLENSSKAQKPFLLNPQPIDIDADEPDSCMVQKNTSTAAQNQLIPINPEPIDVDEENVCMDTGPDLLCLKEENELCMQMIRVIAHGVNHEKKNEKEVLTSLCKGKSPACKRIPLWYKLRIQTMIKLNHLMNAQDRAITLPVGHRMTITEWLLFDTIIVHQDINVIGMSEQTMEDRQILVDLFVLVGQFDVENLTGDELAEAWSAITMTYNKENRACTPMLLQRRWYQLKLATRHRYDKFWSLYQGIQANLEAAQCYTPTQLQTAIVKRYKSLVLKPFMKWSELIIKKRVILRDQFERIALSKKAQDSELTPNQNLESQISTTICIEETVTPSPSEASEASTNTEMEEYSDVIIKDEIEIEEHDLIDPFEQKPVLLNEPVLENKTLLLNPSVFRNEPILQNKTLLLNEPVLQNKTLLLNEPVLPIKPAMIIPTISDTVSEINDLHAQTSTLNIIVKVEPEEADVVYRETLVVDTEENDIKPDLSDLELGNLQLDDPINEEFGERNGFSNEKDFEDAAEPTTELQNEKRSTVLKVRINGIRTLDEKLFKAPIVYTMKLEDMNVLPLHLLKRVNGKHIIERIYAKSKPVYTQRKIMSKSRKKEPKRLKISNALFQKPYHCLNYSGKIIKNPDFMTSLRKLTRAFYKNQKNIRLLKSCKPVTVDVSKEFEKRLVNGIMYLANDDSVDTDYDDDEPLASLKINKSVDIEGVKTVVPKPITFNLPVISKLQNQPQMPPLQPVRNKNKIDPSPSGNIKNTAALLGNATKSPRATFVPSVILPPPLIPITQKSFETSSRSNKTILTDKSKLQNEANMPCLINLAGNLKNKDAASMSKDPPRLQKLGIKPNAENTFFILNPSTLQKIIQTTIPETLDKDSINKEASSYLKNSSPMIDKRKESTKQPWPTDNGNSTSHSSIHADTLNDKLSLLSDDNTNDKRQSTSTLKNQNIIYCCWTQERLNNKHLTRKHDCPVFSCHCCCKSTLVNQVQRTTPGPERPPEPTPSTSEPINFNLAEHTMSANDLNSIIEISKFRQISHHDQMAKTRNKQIESLPVTPKIIVHPVQLISVSPSAYFSPQIDDDSTIILDNHKVLLTTTKLPPNFNKFVEFRRRVRRMLSLPNGIQLDIKPNGRVTLLRQPKAYINNKMLAALSDLVKEFYKTENNSQNIDPTSEKYTIEDSQTIVKRNNIDKTNSFNEKNNNVQLDMPIYKNEDVNPVTEKSKTKPVISELDECLSKFTKEVLNKPPLTQKPLPKHSNTDVKIILNIMQSKLGSFIAKSLYPITRQYEFDYVYSRNGLFFKFDLESGLLQPSEIRIKNRPTQNPIPISKNTSGNDCLSNPLIATPFTSKPNVMSVIPQPGVPKEVQKRNKKNKVKNNPFDPVNYPKIAPKKTKTTETPPNVFMVIEPLIGAPTPHTDENTIEIKSEEEMPAVNLTDSLFEVEECFLGT